MVGFCEVVPMLLQLLFQRYQVRNLKERMSGLALHPLMQKWVQLRGSADNGISASCCHVEKVALLIVNSALCHKRSWCEDIFGFLKIFRCTAVFLRKHGCECCKIVLLMHERSLLLRCIIAYFSGAVNQDMLAEDSFSCISLGKKRFFLASVKKPVRSLDKTAGNLL